MLSLIKAVGLKLGLESGSVVLPTTDRGKQSVKLPAATTWLHLLPANSVGQEDLPPAVFLCFPARYRP